MYKFAMQHDLERGVLVFYWPDHTTTELTMAMVVAAIERQPQILPVLLRWTNAKTSETKKQTPKPVKSKPKRRIAVPPLENTPGTIIMTKPNQATLVELPFGSTGNWPKDLSDSDGARFFGIETGRRVGPVVRDGMNLIVDPDTATRMRRSEPLIQAKDL